MSKHRREHSNSRSPLQLHPSIGMASDDEFARASVKPEHLYEPQPVEFDGVSGTHIYAPYADFPPQPTYAPSVGSHSQPGSGYVSPQPSTSSSLSSAQTSAGATTPVLHGLGVTTLPSLSGMHYPQPSYPVHLPSPRIDHAVYADGGDWTAPRTRTRSHEFSELPVHRPQPVPVPYARYSTAISGSQSYCGPLPSTMPSPPNTPRYLDNGRASHGQQWEMSSPRMPLAPANYSDIQQQRPRYYQTHSEPYIHRQPSFEGVYANSSLAPPYAIDSDPRQGGFRRVSDPEYITHPSNGYLPHQQQLDYEPARVLRTAPMSSNPHGGQSKIRFDLRPTERSRTVSEGSTNFSEEDRHETVTPFISKLNHLLSNAEYASFIRWNAEGTCFVFAPQSQELLDVFSRFFRHSNVHSFVRQLNIYSFTRLSMLELLNAIESTHPPDSPLVSSDFAGFAHPLFFRGDGCDLTKIKPKTVPKKRSRKDLKQDLAMSAMSGPLRGLRDAGHHKLNGILVRKAPY